MNVDTGVYSITNVVNGKKYIGSSVSFIRRWRLHKTQLRTGSHHSRYLQSAWDKYGEESFIFSKISLCPVTDLIVTEQARIDELRPEYNVCGVAGSPLGVKRTEEWCARNSAFRKGKNMGADNFYARAVVRVGTDECFGSAREAARFLKESGNPNAHHSAIIAACSGAQNTAYGSPWRYVGDLKKSTFSNHRDGANNRLSRSVVCLEEDHNFRSIGDAMQWLKGKGHSRVSRSAICKACSGKRETAYGFHWKYAD